MACPQNANAMVEAAMLAQKESALEAENYSSQPELLENEQKAVNKGCAAGMICLSCPPAAESSWVSVPEQKV